MQHMLCADDGVYRAGVTAVHAANATRLVDDGDEVTAVSLLCERQYVFSEKVRKPPYRVIAARRAQVDPGRTIDDGGRVRSAARVTALGTLRLWKQGIDLLNEIRRPGR